MSETAGLAGRLRALRPRFEAALDAVLLLGIFSMPFSIAVSQTALAVALVIAALALTAGWRPPRTGVELPAALFVGWALLDIAFSQIPAESLHHAKRFLLLPALWLYAGAAVRPGMARRLIAALGLGATGVAVVGIVQYLRGPGGLLGRADLVQGYMTAGGLMMLCGLSLVAFLVRLKDWRARLPLLPALMTVLVALVFTYTRNAWLGFGAGTLLLLLLQRPQAAPIFAVLAVLAVVVAPASFRARMLSSFNPEHRTNVQRVIMWKTGWRMLQDHPLTGVGDLDLKAIYSDYHRGEDVEIKGHLHSNLAMFAAIWGWPGLLLALLFLVSLPWQLARRWRALRRLGERAPPLAAAWTLAALAVWLGFMVGGLFEWNFGDAEIALLLWTLMGLGLGGRILEVHVSAHSVTEGDLWVFDPSTRTVIAGDLVTLPVPLFDSACPEGWKRALGELSEVRFERLVPGHGAPMKPAAFATYRKAFDRLLECAAGAADSKTCIDGWFADAKPLVAKSDETYGRTLLAYYMDGFIKPDAAGRKRWCGKAG